MKTFETSVKSQLLLAALKDPRLSFRGKVLLADQLLFRPPSRFSIDEVRPMGKEDLVDVFVALRQLEALGYLRSVTRRFATFDIATFPRRR